jgi:superfamily II DNA or RNA helicase
MNTEALQDMLDQTAWEDSFDDRTTTRAANYYHQGHVLALRHAEEDGVDILMGVVRGSERSPYRCTIRLRSDEQGFDLHSDCSCPVGYHCKHIAALLMVATGTPHEFWPGGNAVSAFPGQLARALLATARPATLPRNELADWNPWLQRLNSGQPLAPVADAERQFGILLRAAPQGSPPELLVSLVWLRPGRSKAGTTKPGQLVDPQPLQLHPRFGPIPTPADGWPTEVVASLALLLHDQYTHAVGQAWIAVRAPHQEQALDILLARYPVYFERGSMPLTRGENLPLQLQWIDQPDGNQQLSAGVAGDTPSQLLRGAQLWYVQPQQQSYGRVDGDAELAASVALAPLVVPEQIGALRQHLRKLPAAGRLPLPAERAPVEIIKLPPTPVLNLFVVLARLGRDATRSPLGCARLSFDYAGAVLPRAARQATERRLLGTRLLEIHRHLSRETELASHLQQLGLQQIGWYSDARGIPSKLVQPDDFQWQPKASRAGQLASAWQPLIEQLVAAGYRIEYSDDFPQQRLLDIEQWHADIEPVGNQWFDLSLGIDVDGQRIDLLPLLRRMLSDPSFPLAAAKREKRNASWRVALDDTRSVEMPLSRLRSLIEPLLEWLQGDGELRLHRTRAESLAEMATAAQLDWRGGDILRTQLDLLRHAKRVANAPRGFKATLRPYQREGLAWLNFLGDSGLGGILADDMGLGKTVQVLAHVLHEKQRGRLKQPALVVAPTSLVGNWRDESARFAPGLKVLVLHGPQRADAYPLIASHDLVITTYPLLPRDEERLREARFSLLILDEAQAIKNPRSHAAKVVRTIPATRRLAMTGTPLENHQGELWAQFDAVEPGLLGSEKQFTKLYRTPIEKHGDSDRQQRLNRRTSALLLRRRKQDVLTDLPAKTEIVHMLELEDAQRGLYETLRLVQHARVQQAVQERGLAQAGIIVLDALLKLRQACCDPRLVKLPSARKIRQSAKLDALLELLDGLLGEGRRVLLFSQFTEMLALIEAALRKRRIDYQILTGQTPPRERSALVKRFQNGDTPVFLISLKAGGVGLNLTAADTVIHYDPWWNPAVEAQATDRAHRIGQDKPVFVYRLICAGTVEEKIQAMQGRKAELARAVLEGGASTRLRFDENDLRELFAPL